MVNVRKFTAVFESLGGGSMWPTLDRFTALNSDFIAIEDTVIFGLYLSAAFGIVTLPLIHFGALVHTSGDPPATITVQQSADVIAHLFAYATVATPPIHRSVGVMFTEPNYLLLRMGERIVPYCTNVVTGLGDAAAFAFTIYYNLLREVEHEKKVK
jgi:hypothetical protein